MTNSVISSPANPLIKRVHALGKRKYRDQHGEFFVEGIRSVWMAYESGANLESVLVAPDLLKSGAARHMLDRVAASGIDVNTISRGLFESLAERENPSGLGAIVRASPLQLDELAVSGNSIFVALNNIGNPGNLGTIIRTVDGVGGSGVILIGDTTDPYNPTAVKASMGTLFTVPIARAREWETVADWIRSHKIQLVGTAVQSSSNYWSIRYARPTLFLFGGEGMGLDQNELQSVDVRVRIPMEGKADSLNLAVSAGVILYEAKRQHDEAGRNES